MRQLIGDKLVRFIFLQGKWDVQPKVDLSKHQHCSWQSMRLPTTVVPVLYELSLYTDMEVSPAASLESPGMMVLCMYLAASWHISRWTGNPPRCPVKADFLLIRTSGPEICHVVSQEPFAVNGSVLITVNMTEASPCVVLHAREMSISHVAIEEPHTHGELGSWHSSHPKLHLHVDWDVLPPHTTLQ